MNVYEHINNRTKAQGACSEATGIRRRCGVALFANRTAKGSICRISAYFAEIKARYEQLWLMTPSL
ncbi:hypothetical protein OXB_0797 [Bacillus sp. OxB-1]|nr:hypothetical protein OXB_0797 [Bacillus sp. OxB-1]